MRSEGTRPASRRWFCAARRITRLVDMSDASLDGTLNANGLHASNLVMGSAGFKDVDLTGAEITEDISMVGA
jgi:hypothetical protein